MGTEILILFLPIPFLFWLCNIWQLFNVEKRTKAILMLVIGLTFVGAFCLPYSTYQYFVQGLIFSGFFYIPFYVIVSWLLGMVLAISTKRRGV
jgi:hypothetical protein